MALKAQTTFPAQGLHDNTPTLHAFVNCTIMAAPGTTIDGATLIIRDGIVENIGKLSTIPNDAVRHDLKGAWILPGFIDPYTQHGLKKEAPRPFTPGAGPRYTASNPGPYAWNDAIKSYTSAAETIEYDPKKAQEWLEAGFTTLHTIPDDGIFRGTGSIIHLHQGPLQAALFRPVAAAALSFRKGSSQQAYPESLMGAIALLRQTFIDVAWYAQLQTARAAQPGMRPLETNLALQAIHDQLQARIPLFFECQNWQDIFRAAWIAKEAGISFIYKATHDTYKRIPDLQKLGSPLILPLDFPEPFDVTDIAEARELSFEKLSEWENAPRTPALAAAAKIPYAFTAFGLKKPRQAWDGIAKAIRHGLSPEDALTALTIAPARILGIDKQLGSLEPGKIASFVIYEDNPFVHGEPVVLEAWAAGSRHKALAIPDHDPRATYSLQVDDRTFPLLISGTLTTPKVRIVVEKDTLKGDISLEGRDLRLSFPIQRGKETITYRLSGIFEPARMIGTGQRPDGKRVAWTADRTGPPVFDPKEKDTKKPLEPENLSLIPPIRYPQVAFGLDKLPEQGTFIIRNVTAWTNTPQGIQQNTDLIIAQGKIQSIGTNLPLPPGAREIDGTGKHLTPGIIDEHSHICIQNGVNEGSHAITAEVRIGDVLDAEDINMYRQLSGGITVAQLLHGSANPIGGQSQIIKLRWGSLPEELKFQEAPGFIKFALGENVKQSNWGDQYRQRYPQTREGVEQIIKDAFQSALDYKKERDANQLGRGDQPPFRRDLQMETLLEILDSKRFITCHSYVQSEILMLIRLAESFNFRINTFTHILEGYKLATEMKAHGASASTFSDWWAYKFEVYDAIPYNAALLNAQGLNVCINSDDAEMARRLNQEAAKTIKYGGVSEEDALKMITLNPAKALHIDQWVGSLEKGKSGDVVLWSAHPLSVYAQAELTFIDGKLYFDRAADLQAREWLAKERERILGKMAATPSKEKRKPTAGEGPQLFHCETIESDYNHE